MFWGLDKLFGGRDEVASPQDTGEVVTLQPVSSTPDEPQDDTVGAIRFMIVSLFNFNQNPDG